MLPSASGVLSSVVGMDRLAVAEPAAKVTEVGAGPERKSPVGRTLTLTSSSCERPPTRVNVNTALSPSVMASGAVNDTSGSSSRTVTSAEEPLLRA